MLRKINLSRRFGLAVLTPSLFLGLIGVFHNAAPASADETPAAVSSYTAEMAELAAASDAIVIAAVEKQDIGIAETTAQLRVSQWFKGPGIGNSLLRFRTRIGRAMVTADEPELTGISQAVFFLSLQPDGSYRCVKKNYGFKPIINDNVYLNPQDPLKTAKLNTYTSSLTQLFKTRQDLLAPPVKA